MIIYITGFPETTIGHGGANRSHQVASDLRSAFPEEEFEVFCWSDLPGRASLDNQYTPPKLAKRLIRQVRNATKQWLSSDQASVLADKISMSKFNGLPGKDYYEYFLKSRSHQKILSVVSGAQFTDALEVNHRLRIPTILCPQNLDSLAAHACREKSNDRISSACNSLCTELSEYSKAHLTLAISKVEFSLLKGLDLKVEFYPYRPSGLVRKALLDIRARRDNTTRQSKEFILLGTAEWGPSAHGLISALDTIRKSPNPNAKFIVAGQGTEKLMQPDDAKLGITFTGRLDDDQYIRTLAIVSGAIVPVTVGFGAITRLADFSCAGLPVITTELAANGVNLPPGICIAKRMEDISDPLRLLPPAPSMDEYIEWERGNAPNWSHWKNLVA